MMFWLKEHFQKGIICGPTPKIEAYQAMLKINAIFSIPSMGNFTVYYYQVSN